MKAITSGDERSMMKSSSCVSIGLPVYNGERFLKDALDSILRQTYRDFELIISDNASTDRTEEICRSYAARDRRIRYYRNEKNLGAARNYNQVFELSTGQYFKWAAHDDIYAPDFLLKCAEVLERDPGVVVCFPRTVQIDEQGRWEKKTHYDLPNLHSPRAHERFHDIIAKRHGCEAVFGVIRADGLRRTPLIGNYIGSDRVLLALLSIEGRFHELPDYLFFFREHTRRSVKGQDHEVTVWFDPMREGKIVFPEWRILSEYLRTIARASLVPSERLRCLWQLVKWVRCNGQTLKWDLTSALDRVLPLRGSHLVYRHLHKWILSGRFPLPKWMATSIGLFVMIVVEGSRWAFRVDKWSYRWNDTRKKVL